MFLFYFILILMQAMKAKNENTFLNSPKTSGLGYDLGTPDLWYDATKQDGPSETETEKTEVLCVITSMAR